jgi:hypothetical protein
MSKIGQVKKDLFARQDIVIVDIKQKTYPLSGVGGWNETFDFFIAPMKGVYEATALQKLMLGLITLEPTCMDSFCSLTTALSFGKLYFDEEIGQITLVGEETLTITDEDYASRMAEEVKKAEYVEGRRKVESITKLHRRTWVRLYPNVRIALTAAHEGKNEYSILATELQESKRPIARLLARLGIRS